MSIPDDVEGLLYLGMDGGQHVNTSLTEQASEADVEPVSELRMVDGHELGQYIEEHTEHLAVGVMKHSCEDLRHSLHFSAPSQ